MQIERSFIILYGKKSQPVKNKIGEHTLLVGLFAYTELH